MSEHYSLCEIRTTVTDISLKYDQQDATFSHQHHHHHHHHHHISVMELGHLLTRSGLTYPEVSSKVCHDSFCQLENSVSLPWVIYYVAFYLHVVSSFSCIPVICLKLVLFLIPLQLVHLFCNQSKCILLFFSCIDIDLYKTRILYEPKKKDKIVTYTAFCGDNYGVFAACFENKVRIFVA